jgi:hypothetical protein
MPLDPAGSLPGKPDQDYHSSRNNDLSNYHLSTHYYTIRLMRMSVAISSDTQSTVPSSALCK